MGIEFAAEPRGTSCCWCPLEELPAPWMRFSFGPPVDNMVKGLDRLEAMLRA